MEKKENVQETVQKIKKQEIIVKKETIIKQRNIYDEIFK